jgi:hypothetical protein
MCEVSMRRTRPAVIDDYTRKNLVVRTNDELGLLVVILDAHVKHRDALPFTLIDGPQARDSVEVGCAMFEM